MTKLHKETKLADLELVGIENYKELGLPWGVLIEVPREDFSQAAARIVREATERD